MSPAPSATPADPPVACAADTAVVWFHAGTDPLGRRDDHYVHVGTREAATARQGGDRTLHRLRIVARNPLNTPAQPLYDHEANRLGMYDSVQRALGRVPVATDFDEDYEECVEYAQDLAWSPAHDVIYYWNVCEGSGSLSAMVRSSSLRPA